ncbi:uncharacterized protein LOC62_02G001962 [Vanrija pseudolonga]|uniref:Uncharacterized protein n=1 Tax=Vanrija pseudolonga TaxID=143232 RepID=A0AAF0Y1R6_9TREE|nr:hypothetical protein LOC62_02G001962 [Vanrija pseudolonga]
MLAFDHLIHVLWAFAASSLVTRVQGAAININNQHELGARGDSPYEPSCGDVQTTIGWQPISWELIPKNGTSDVIRLSEDRYCCGGICPNFIKTQTHTVTTTWSNSVQASFGINTLQAGQGLLSKAAAKFDFGDTYTYSESVSSADLTTDECKDKPTRSGLNCQAVVVQPYFLRIYYNAQVYKTQTCERPHLKTEEIPGSRFSVTNEYVDIPKKRIDTNGKEVPDGIFDCWGECQRADPNYCSGASPSSSPSPIPQQQGDGKRTAGRTRTRQR